MKVRVDPARCIAAGHCALAAGAVFAQGDDDGIAYVLDEAPPEALRAAVTEAVAICPSGAISLSD